MTVGLGNPDLGRKAHAFRGEAQRIQLGLVQIGSRLWVHSYKYGRTEPYDLVCNQRDNDK